MRANKEEEDREREREEGKEGERERETAVYLERLVQLDHIRHSVLLSVRARVGGLVDLPCRRVALVSVPASVKLGQRGERVSGR